MDEINVEILTFESEQIAILATFKVPGRIGQNMYVPLYSDLWDELTKKPPLYDVLPKYTREPTKEELPEVERWRNTLAFTENVPIMYRLK